jgi:hypothetical protein
VTADQDWADLARVGLADYSIPMPGADVAEPPPASRLPGLPVMAKPTGEYCPRCRAEIRRGLVACRADWYALPEEIRAGINANYTPKQDILTATKEYMQFHKMALAWFRAHPKETPE